MNICLFREDEIGKPLSLRDERARHILKILHKKEGDCFHAGIIEGFEGEAKITKIENFSRKSADGKKEFDDGKMYFTFEAKNSGKPLYPLKMIIGFPRPIQLKRLLRDMAGLGVCEIHLAGSDLGEKSYLCSDLADENELHKLLLEGTVQAGGTYVPKVFLHKSLDECFADLGIFCDGDEEFEVNDGDLLASRESSVGAGDFLVNGDSSVGGEDFCANGESSVGAENSLANGASSASGENSLTNGASSVSGETKYFALDNVNPKSSLLKELNFLQSNSNGAPCLKSAFAAIGSERGWSERERKLLETCGFVRCGMGNRVLRTETAATVAATLILAKMNFL